MSGDDLLHHLAALIALERRSVADEAAATLPEWLDLVTVLRAKDGIEQLAHALDARRRRDAA